MSAVDVTGAAAPEVKPTSPVAPTTEAPKEEVKANPDMEKRFEQMARREKMLRAQAREIEQQRKEIAEREARLLQPQQPNWQEKLKNDLTGTLTEAGFSYEDVLNQFVNNTPQDIAIRQLQRQLQAYEDGQKKLQDSLQEQQKQSYSQALKQIKTEVAQLVKVSPDDFETLAANGESAQQAVVKLIEQTFNEEGYVMDVADACQQVEDYLVEQAVQLAKLKKVQAKLTPAQVAEKAEAAKPGTTVTPAAKTLTHSTTTTSKPMTAKERRERAINAFLGKTSE